MELGDAADGESAVKPGHGRVGEIVRDADSGGGFVFVASFRQWFLQRGHGCVVGHLCCV